MSVAAVMVRTYRRVGAGIRPDRLFRALAMVTSQGVISLGFFATNLLLIRSVAPDEFGEYATILGTFFLAASCFGACVIYPMTLEAAKPGIVQRELFGATLVSGLVAAVPLSILVAAAAWFIASPRDAVLAAVALTVWLMQAVTRRSLIVQRRILLAALGDGICHIGLPLGVLLASKLHVVSIGAAFGSLALSAGLAVALQAWQAGVRPGNLRLSRPLLVKFWQVGRITLVGALGEVIAPQVVVWTLLLVHGKSMVAAHSAIISLVGVSHPLIFSIQSIVVPAVSRRVAQGGNRSAIVAGIADAAPLALAAMSFVLLIAAFPVQIITTVFGAGDRYLAFAGALRLCALCYIVVILAECMNALLLGLGWLRPQRNMQLAGLAAALGAGTSLAAAFGVFGSAISPGVAAGARSSVAIGALWRGLRLRPAYPEPRR